MLIKEKLGNIYTLVTGRDIDIVIIEWYETNKRILHKQTVSGVAITIQFLKESPNLQDGDILWQDENLVIVVQIKLCECIIISTDSLLTVASICYEIGNRHLPLFYEGDDLLVPYEAPLYNVLCASGYQLKTGQRKLSNALKTTVLPHLRVARTDSLFGKIFQPATSL